MKTKLDPTQIQLTEIVAAAMVRRLAALRYFPSDPSAQSPIVDLVLSMCHTEAEAAWLIGAMTSGIYNDWPGLQEMRACFCAMFQPKDGLECYSQKYAGGFNFPLKLVTEGRQAKGLEALPAPEVRALLSSSEMPEQGAEDALRIAATVQRIKDRPMQGPATKEEIAAAPEWLRKMEGYE